MTETQLGAAWSRAVEESEARAPLSSVKSRATGRWGRKRWLAVGLLLASGAAGVPAMAQGKRVPVLEMKCAAVQATKGSPSAVASDRDVVKLHDEGMKAARAGQWEKARVALLEAFTRKPHCKIAATLGWAELMAGKPRDAAEHLSFFLREAQDVSAADRQKVEKMLAEAKATIGTVTVQVDAEGAEVLVDEQTVGTAPLAEPPSPVQTSGLDVGAPSEPAGPRWRTWPFIGSAGLAVVGIGLGVGLTVAANGKSQAATDQLNELKIHTPTSYRVCGTGKFPLNERGCAELKDALRAQDRLTNAAALGYVVGGVAAVGAAAFLLWPRPHPGRVGVQVLPAIGSGRGGMVVQGSF
jgi:hypothetical protein